MGASVLYLVLPCARCGAASGEPCVRRNGDLASRAHSGRTPLAPCGTKGGYERHKKAHETPCAACRDAERRYMADYRRDNPERRNQDIAQLRARREAIKRLIALHRHDFDRLLAEERAR